MERHGRHVTQLISLLSLATVAIALIAVPAQGRVARPSAATMPAPVPCNLSAGHCWKPAVKARWQYQLQGSPDSTAAVATRAPGSSTSA